MRHVLSAFSLKKSLLALGFAFVCTVIVGFWYTYSLEARSMSHYSDTLSTSAPNQFSNHTITFTPITNIPAGSVFTFTPDTGFAIVAVSGTSTFSERNVEMYVNGTPRTSSSTGDATTDEVLVTAGSPGSIQYTLNPSTGISANDVVTFRIGDHTTYSFNGGSTYNASSGTTTLPNDISGIRNSAATGRHAVSMDVAGAPVSGDFIIFLIEPVTIGPADTTEDVPPFRFNGLPTGYVGGTTLNVEMSLETDEFATCKFSTTASTSYAAMTDMFDSTGSIVHTHLLENLANATVYNIYVRCEDDEGNVNIDDYVISFEILDVPDGTPNETGSTTGDGTGSGDDGTGSGSEEGGATGSGGTGSNTSGGSSGSGGSGGGTGGGSGGGGSSGGGGGFESSDEPYRSGDGEVRISGYAFPGGKIYVLVDGQEAETGSANSSGAFSVTISEIARGPYTFGIYATDRSGTKSSTFSTTFYVQGARTSSLSNVNIMPTIKVTPDPVDLGGVATLSGYAIPNAEITIETLSDKGGSSKKTYTTTSNSSGVWTYEMSTAGFSQGTYKVRAKAERASDGIETNFSDYTYYGIGEQADTPISADLNRDGKVNLIDFSILLFHWGTDGGTSDPPADINRDGNVSLTDFSIMLFQWTG